MSPLDLPAMLMVAWRIIGIEAIAGRAAPGEQRVALQDR
jgi:hypothetical protein